MGYGYVAVFGLFLGIGLDFFLILVRQVQQRRQLARTRPINMNYLQVRKAVSMLSTERKINTDKALLLIRRREHLDDTGLLHRQIYQVAGVAGEHTDQHLPMLVWVDLDRCQLEIARFFEKDGEEGLANDALGRVGASFGEVVVYLFLRLAPHAESPITTG